MIDPGSGSGIVSRGRPESGGWKPAAPEDDGGGAEERCISEPSKATSVSAWKIATAILPHLNDLQSVRDDV